MELTMERMLAMQRRLQDKYAAQWGEPIEPATALRKYLWAIGELAEAADIVKKCGDEEIMNDPGVRHDFVEEMGDVFMYLFDVMLCLGAEARALGVQKVGELFSGQGEQEPRRALLRLYGLMSRAGEALLAGEAQAFIPQIQPVMRALAAAMECYQVSPEEFSQIYQEKCDRNINRW
jgi:NTP pyrophosphatase (non-canonical NTP hydrolase)